MLYLCRLCLKKSKYGYSLFSDEIFEKLESLTSIKISQNDNLPQTCCKSCMGSVCFAYEFQQSIILADKTLRKLQYPIKDEVKIEEEYNYNDYEETVDYDVNNEASVSNCSTEAEITDVVMLEDKDIFEIKFVNDCATSNKEGDTSLKAESTNDLNVKKKIPKDVNKSGSSLQCSECGETMNSKKLLQQHMAKHRVDNCPVCFIVMRRDNIKKHMQIHVESPEVCEICGKIAKNKESLRGHMNYLHKKKAKTKCDYCHKEFKSTNHCNTHMRNVHLGIRNHQCHICGKKFFSNHDLNKHINITHKRARPYVCPYCEKGFSSLYARKTHIRQHTHETPYMCHICSAGFRQKVSLITHIASKHQQRFSNTNDEETPEMLDTD